MSDQGSVDAVGLCAFCKHGEIVRSAKRSVFYMCTRSKTDRKFPKYPRLPMLSCPGHERKTWPDETGTTVK